MKTNQEWLQSLDTEELVDTIVELVCGTLEQCGIECSREYYKHDLTKWMKEKYEED